MSQFHPDIAVTNLKLLFKDEFINIVMKCLNPGEVRILNECWEQLHKDLLKYDSETVSVRLFMVHFHSYAS